MSRRRRKRVETRTVVIDWTPALGEMFGRLPKAFGLTPPAKAKVQIRGDRSTWSARYTNDAGQPVTAHVRLNHLVGGDVEVLAERINLRFSALPVRPAPKPATIVVDEFAFADDVSYRHRGRVEPVEGCACQCCQAATIMADGRP